MDSVLFSDESRLRILISAYGCGPGRGSEPGYGWNWSVQLARFHEVWVLTPEREKAAIQAYPADKLPSNLHFVFCDLPRFIRPRGARNLLEYMLHYHLWQIWIYFVARRLHASIQFDVVHHLTVGAHWKPSLLSLLPAPFFWGPLGGGEQLPRTFWRFLSWRARLLEVSRILMQTAGELDPLVRLTGRNTELALVRTEDTGRRARALKCRQVRVFSEQGLPDGELAKLATFPIRDGGPICFLSLGRLLHWKGFELGLRAFALLAKQMPEARFCIVGDGPEQVRLKQVAEGLGILNKVEFCGELPRADALAKLADCDVLVHPSLHESGGWVCVEAMAAGRPVICLDHGGPATLVVNDAGFKIPANSPEQSIQGIFEAMELMARNRVMVARMGRAARTHVTQTYAWNKKALVICDLYQPYSERKKLTQQSASYVRV